MTRDGSHSVFFRLRRSTAAAAAGLLVWTVAQSPAGAQAPRTPATAPQNGPAATVAATEPYVLGVGDVLTIVFWREKDLTGDFGIRPDGKISVPLFNDVQAAGLTPEQLRDSLATAAARFFQDPMVTVIVKQINSRRVYITGQVEKPGAYPLTTAMTVIQLIAVAGGLREYADGKHIVVVRPEAGRQILLPFDYDAVSKQRNTRQNLELKPNDTVIVP